MSAVDPFSELLTTADAVRQAQIVGSQPEQELNSKTRWIVFSSIAFEKPLACTFQLKNLDPFTVAFCLKARDRSLFTVSHPYGILKPFATATIRLVLHSYENWLKTLSTQMGHHQVCVESIRIPDKVVPVDQKANIEISREIFKQTANDNPLQRLYWKINIILHKMGSNSEYWK